MTNAQCKRQILEHRRAVCDYRFVWRVCPEHQRAGWRNAALTHERLVRAYSNDLRGLQPREKQHALL